jgi:rhamnosyltransferase
MNNSVSIIVPTLNPGDHLPALRDAFTHQQLQPLEVLIIDSASTDGSPARWRDAGFRLLSIKRADFDHGGTRNLAARQAQGEILVFMTQDAVPADECWLEELVAPITSGEVVATFARHLPREDASLLERFARHFNYPPSSRVKRLSDVQEMGIKAFFFSNACSAVRANTFFEVGGFPERLIMNEDVGLCARLLRAGYKVKYTAEAQIYHSHDYNLRQQFKRNFDIGAFVTQAGSLLEGSRFSGEGMRFVLGQARYIMETGTYFDVVKVFAEAIVKLTAFSLGKRHRWVPSIVRQHLSMHSYYWK